MLNWKADMFVGGHAVMDFLNTVGDSGKTRDNNSIGDWQSVQNWLKASGHFSDLKIKADAPAPLLVKIHRLRETVYCILSAMAQGKSPPNHELSILQATIKSAINRAHFSLGENGGTWVSASENAHQTYDQLVLEIEKFLRTQNLDKLRLCNGCTWLFIDKGRGKGRQWCAMKKCGNRAKSRAFKARKASHKP